MNRQESVTGTRPWHFPVLALCFAAVTFYLGYIASRNHFPSFIAGYGLFFGLYWRVCFGHNAITARQLILLGIGLRVLLLFSLPNLSDDYQRFLWDGRLTVAGYHPFLHPPAYFIDHQIRPPGITPELFGRLNSPHYYTVYPPVCQAVFAMAAWITPENDRLAVVVMKLFLLACELGTIRLLAGSQWPFASRNSASQPSPAALYALNPLVILEIVGNCHFEGAMILFLVAGVVALQQNKLTQPAICWALATASKMLPLLFLPLVWRWLGWRKGLVFNSLFAVATLLLFAPLIAVFPHIVQSLDLYFREFQFNASIYYLVRQVGFWKIGWDIGDLSGPWLALATVAGILLLAWRIKRPVELSGTRLASAMLFTLFLYLSLAAVVQPWYVCVPFALSLLTRWRFALVWTGVAALSYSHYDGGLRQEHFGLIALEYLVLWGFLIRELWGKGTQMTQI